MIKPITQWTDQRIIRRYNAIIREFYRRCAGGTQYGCDWPTMRMLFPELCAEVDELRKEWKRRHVEKQTVDQAVAATATAGV